jgi:hypothetical protein
MDKKTESLSEILIKLRILLNLADKSFENYLETKYYLHALCIRKNNYQIYNFIIENASKFPKNLFPHLILLLNHLDIWFTQFNNYETKKPFKLDDIFVFHRLDNKGVYPKDSVDKIKSYRIKKSVNKN